MDLNKDIKWIDFHCHSLFEHDPECIEIISCHPGKNSSEGFFTCGYHPWWSLDLLNNEQLAILTQTYLKNDYCIGIGECGLDILQGAPLDIQMKNFENQVQIANSLNAPLIIHCVRKFDALIPVFKNMAKTKWVIHGFKRNKTLAKTLIDLDISLSVAPFDQMNVSFTEMLEYIPLDKLFLETDSDRRLSIRDRYKIMSVLRKIPEDSLKLQLFENVKIFFDKIWL